jgi:hypothetical protein
MVAPEIRKEPDLQADQLVAELLARGDMNDDTTIELNRMVADWRAGKLDPEDADYLVALHAKVTNVTPELEDAGHMAGPSRLDGLTIEEWRERALTAEASLADLETVRLSP